MNRFATHDNKVRQESKILKKSGNRICGIIAFIITKSLLSEQTCSPRKAGDYCDKLHPSISPNKTDMRQSFWRPFGDYGFRRKWCAK